MTPELQSIHLRWHENTGEDMPLDIASQPIELIRKAIKWRAKGITVVVDRGVVPMTAEVQESSMMDFDRQDDKNGNSYGS